MDSKIKFLDMTGFLAKETIRKALFFSCGGRVGNYRGKEEMNGE